mmetsp:Transcript_10078/g.12454  ORF Transcript_10078/g.12454 Transcript_10078/m.12454 type:complete len:201 (-) Transcript_10078:129-731(-)
MAPPYSPEPSSSVASLEFSYREIVSARSSSTRLGSLRKLSMIILPSGRERRCFNSSLGRESMQLRMCVRVSTDLRCLWISSDACLLTSFSSSLLSLLPFSDIVFFCSMSSPVAVVGSHRSMGMSSSSSSSSSLWGELRGGGCRVIFRPRFFFRWENDFFFASKRVVDVDVTVVSCLFIFGGGNNVRVLVNDCVTCWKSRT